MERVYVVELFDGLLGENSDDCRDELLRRGFSMKEVDALVDTWRTFHVGEMTYIYEEGSAD